MRIVRRFVQRNPLEAQRQAIRGEIIRHLRGAPANALAPADSSTSASVVTFDEITGEPLYFGMHDVTPHGEFRHS